MRTSLARSLKMTQKVSSREKNETLAWGDKSTVFWLMNIFARG